MKGNTEWKTGGKNAADKNLIPKENVLFDLYFIQCVILKKVVCSTEECNDYTWY